MRDYDFHCPNSQTLYDRDDGNLQGWPSVREYKMAYPPRLREECNGGMWTVESIPRVLAYSSCWIQPDPMTFRKSANSPGEAPGIWPKAPPAGDFTDASVE